jgi:hypothetical protein
MENPIKMDDLGVPPFWETSICWKFFLMMGVVGILVVCSEVLLERNG